MRTTISDNASLVEKANAIRLLTDSTLKPIPAHQWVRRWRAEFQWSAVHEAGHAVASHEMQRELGQHWCQFERVFIRTPEEALTGPYVDARGRSEDCAGMVEGPSRYNPHGTYYPGVILGSADAESVPEAKVKLLARIPRLMEADVIGLFAGPLAEARFRHQSVLPLRLSTAESDWSRARSLAAEWAQDDQTQTQILNSCEARARTLLRRPEVWRAVLALKDALMVQRSIDADEATAIIGVAMATPAELHA